MTLGEKIAALRNEHSLSQENLAEKMSVSRQSVSKWETDTSVPELDKLILLSHIFEITLDELVGNEPVQHQEPEQQTPAAEVQPGKTPFTVQQIIGFILLGVGLFTCILGGVSGREMLILGFYGIICGVICLTVKRHAGLVIAWVIFLPVFFLSPYFLMTSKEYWAFMLGLGLLLGVYTGRLFCILRKERMK